jgi:hypothetical protein
MSPVEYLQGGGWKRALFGPLLMLAVVSTMVGLKDARTGSQDFQWSGERVLLGHVDPWAEYLKGDPEHRFVKSQVPNYLPILYVLLVPFGLLPMGLANAAWACCNVGLAVGSALCAARFYGLRGWGAAGVVLGMLAATPTRTSIGNGQQSLLVLQIVCLALLADRMTRGRSALAGIAYLKFSFAPPFALLLLLRSGLRGFLWSLAPVVLGLGLVWGWLAWGGHSINVAAMAVEPFRVALHGFSPDPADPNLMELVETLLPGRSEGLISGVGGALALALCGAVGWAAFRLKAEGSLQWQIALAATLSFAVFKHHSYDGVVLLLPGCFGLAHWRERRAQVVLGVLLYLLLLQRGVDALHLQPSWSAIPGFAMLMLVLVLCFQIGVPREREVSASDPREVPAGAQQAA